MFFSKKLKLLFIASPKSGSTSVEDYLMKIDPDGEKYRLSLGNRIITSKDVSHGVVGHARAWELKNALGEDYYNELEVIGFVRHPLDKLISSYFFNKKLKIFEAFKIKGEKNLFKRKIQGFVTRIAPKILPLNIWALLFPMKTSYEYFHDKSGNRIVNFLGRTDELDKDLKVILRKLGIEEDIKVPHSNKSDHKSRDEYFKNKLIKKYLKKKYKRDLMLYKEVEKEILKLHK